MNVKFYRVKGPKNVHRNAISSEGVCVMGVGLQYDEGYKE